VTDLTSPRLTVAIPVYGVTGEQLVRCARSADAALAPTDDLFLVLDGPQPYRVDELHLPARAKVIAHADRLGLVGNWNRCLAVGTGEAIHLLHADDEVHLHFYEAVREALRGWPECAFVIAGPTSTPVMLEPDSAARLLVSRRCPAVGSAVYVRTVGRQPIQFAAAYPYCPDEELLPRLASRGGIVLIPGHLYREQRWAGQARFATWERADFVDVYWNARRDAVCAYAVPIQRFAMAETRSVVVTVCAHLIRAGKAELAMNHLRALRRLDPDASRSLRVMAARFFAAVPAGAAFLRAVDLMRGRT
jgi:hypothetical protein